MSATIWDELCHLRADEDLAWELFHENSKVGRYDEFPTQPQVLERMHRMNESLPYEGYPAFELPVDLPALGLSIEGAIRARASCRAMRPGPMPMATLAALLYYAYGVTRSNEGTGLPRGSRAVPSGGALFPLDIFFHTKSVVGLPPGLYHYNPLANVVHRIRDDDLSAELASALVAFQSQLAHQVSVLFFLTALFERSTFKYGPRGYRFVLLEAGHVAQNLNLVATALGKGCINIGGYHDRDIDRLLDLDGLRQSTIYMVGVGEVAAELGTVQGRGET